MCAWGWGWGQNLLSGQGLKSFMYLIPKLEESGKLRAKLTGPWTQLPRPEHRGDGVSHICSSADMEQLIVQGRACGLDVLSLVPSASIMLLYLMFFTRTKVSTCAQKGLNQLLN